MEIRLTEHPESPPNTCTICGRGSGHGLFVDFKIDSLVVPTVHGPQTVEGNLYICLGTAENTGCLAQAIEQAGGASPFTVAELTERVKARMLEYEEEIEILTAERDHAQENRVVQIPVNGVTALKGLLDAPFGHLEEPDADEELAPLDPAPMIQPPAPPHPDSLRNLEGRLSMNRGDGRAGAMVGIE